MIRCPNCDSEYAETLDQCPNCAAAADQDAVQCRRCGQEFVGGDSCPACGLLRVEVACDKHPAETAQSRCVLCGRALCSQCVMDDRNVALCEQHRTVAVIEGWAQVYSTHTEVEAQLLRENLQAEGIDAQVFSQKDMMFNFDLGEMSIVRLLVPVWEYEQALRMIQERMDLQGEVAFACSACGQPFEPGARECGACGAALV